MSGKLLPFVAALRGHSVKSAHGQGGECVDLVEAWAATLDLDAIAGNATELLREANRGQWTVIQNLPANYPTAGDIVVWQQGPRTGPLGLGPNGHCGITIVADSMWLLSFDQNWPAGSKAELVLHGYLGVAGWLTPRR